MDRGVFEAYFGPYAGRAFASADWGPPNINTATITTLRAVRGIGEGKAEQIVRERDTNGPFKSLEDANRRLRRIGMGVLSLLSYPHAQ